MAEKKKSEKSRRNMQRATDTLSEMLAQEVRELHLQQKAREENEPPDLKMMREMTAILKDLAAVAKSLQEQGNIETEDAFGVVLLPTVEKEA